MASYFCQVDHADDGGGEDPYDRDENNDLSSLPDISVWLAKHSETASVQERPKTHLRAMSENALEKYHHHNCPHRQHQYVKGPGPLQASGSGNISDRRECSSLTGDGKTSHLFYEK